MFAQHKQTRGLALLRALAVALERARPPLIADPARSHRVPATQLLSRTLVHMLPTAAPPQARRAPPTLRTTDRKAMPMLATAMFATNDTSSIPCAAAPATLAQHSNVDPCAASPHYPAACNDLPCCDCFSTFRAVLLCYVCDNTTTQFREVKVQFLRFLHETYRVF